MAPSPGHTPEPTTPGGATAVIVTIGHTALPGQLWDNPAGRDLAARLPLILTFGDDNAVEKTARLDAVLTMDGMPAGDDPNPVRSAGTHPPRSWSCTTATWATGTGSRAWAPSAPAGSTSSPTARSTSPGPRFAG